MKERLGNYIKEYSVKNKAGEDIPVYSVTNTQGFCKDYFGKEVASKDKTTYKIVPRGCFAYNPSRINVGSVDYQRYEDRVIVSPLYNVFSVSEKLDIQYLYYYLKSNIVLQRIRTVASGSVRDNLKLSMLYEFPITIRNIDEQKSVVRKLDKIKSVIDLRKAELQQLEELVKSRFVEMFGDPTDIRLDRVSLAEYVENTKYGTSQPPRFDENGCFKFIRATNIKNGHITEKDMLFISKAESEKISKCKLNGGELIIVRSGANTGDTCIITDEYKGQYAGYDIIVTLKTDKLNPVFLNELINIPQYMKMIVKPLTARSAQPHLNTQQVHSLPILVVDIDKQNEFATFVEQVDKSKSVVQKALDEAQILFDSLMQEFFG